MQNDIVPDFGKNDDSTSLGEGFADIQAFAMTEITAKTPVVERECLAAWDASAYVPPDRCLRRVNGSKHYPSTWSTRASRTSTAVWSGTLYDLFQETDLGPAEGYKLVVESIFLYDARERFTAAAEALLMADVSLYGSMHVNAIRRV